MPLQGGIVYIHNTQGVTLGWELLPFQGVWSIFRLEAEAELCICHGVIVLSQRLVVDQRILGEDGDSYWQFKEFMSIGFSYSF